MAAVDDVGHAGGILALWNPTYTNFMAYRFFGGILLSGKIRGIRNTLNILNLYAPCQNRHEFWKRMDSSGIFTIQNLISMGDFNTTLRVNESWGHRARADPMAVYIGGILEKTKMVDIHPNPIIPTWTNMRTGDEFIGKRIDRAMVKEHMMAWMGNMCSFTHVSDISDHMAIILSWRTECRQIGRAHV